MSAIPLILGGHSFIAQLGSEPRPDEKQIDAIVSACLDGGIRHFDTTYRPERIALGASLRRLGRRKEARIVVWNLFEMFDDQGSCGGAQAWQSHHMDEVTADLQTETLEELVVHPLKDAAEQEAQEQVAQGWKSQGRVQKLGVWFPAQDLPGWQTRDCYDFAVEPCNLFTPRAAERLALYHGHGLETYATSPFVRGWQLEKLVAVAVQAGENEGEARAKIADALLRFSLFSPHVSRLIVAMRRADWVAPNLESARRGPLSALENEWLQSLKNEAV